MVVRVRHARVREAATHEVSCGWATQSQIPDGSQTDPDPCTRIPGPTPIPIRTCCSFPIPILPCSFLDLDVTALRPVHGRDCYGAIVKETSSCCLIYAEPLLGVVFPTQQP